MEKNNYESLLDAFRDLNSVSDDEVLTPTLKEKLKEGKSVSIHAGSNELADAKEFMESAHDKDEIEVIDVDADNLEHIKDKKEYIGQVILQCNKCHTNRFIDVEELEASPDDEDLYNEEDACPHCHVENVGFKVIGQVGKVAKEETPIDDEVVIDNEEQKTDELRFENDGEEELDTTEEQEEPEEEISADDELDFTEEEESDGMETDVTEEDDDDLELPELGDEFDADENIRPDDTSDDIEVEEVEEESEEEPEEEVKPVRKKLRLPTREALQMIRKAKCKITEDVINKIILPESVDKVIVKNGSKKLYEGMIEELPEEILHSDMAGFNVANSYLVCNIDNAEDNIDFPLAKMLNSFNDNDTIKIIISDSETDQELFQGSKADALKKFGHCQLISVNAPKALCFEIQSVSNKCTDDTCVCGHCNDAELTTEDELCNSIFAANDLAKYNVDDTRSEEYWISESVYNKEDLKLVFDRYVNGTSNKLIEEFKAVTGYKDELEEMCDKHNVKFITKTDEGLLGNDFNELLNLAKQLGITTLAQLQDFSKRNGNIKDNALLDALRNAVNNKTNNGLGLTENIISVKTRKELSEALEKIVANNEPYKIKRSKKAGYRYDLICEAVEEPIEDDIDFNISDEEYLEEAQLFAKEIATYSFEKCEALYYDDYGFDVNSPADEAEQLIADALIARMEEISSRKPVIAGEAVDEDFEVEESDIDEALTEPKSGETEQEYISRFIETEKAKKEFPDKIQRLAVAYTKFNAKKEDLEETFDENTGDDFKDKMAFLANDELEAIAGYKEVIEFFKEKGIDEDKIMDRLIELQEDEEEHIEELKELYAAITGEDFMEIEPEKQIEDDPEHDLEGELVPENEAEQAELPIEDEEELEVIDLAPVDEALENSYRIIRTSRHYDPEGLNILDPKKVFESNTLEECKKELQNIYTDFKSNSFYKNRLIEMNSKGDQLTITGPQHVAYFTIISNNQVDESLSEELNNINLDNKSFADITSNIKSIHEGLNEDSDKEFFGTKIGTEEADYVLFALQTFFGTPQLNYEDFKNDPEITMEVVEKATKYVQDKDLNKSNYFNENEDEDDVEFDTDSFDNDLNEYFKEAYKGASVTYKTTSGIIDTAGNILLEGHISSDISESDVTFKLTPIETITEALDKKSLQEKVKTISYRATNNLSDEVFEFKHSSK